MNRRTLLVTVVLGTTGLLRSARAGVQGSVLTTLSSGLKNGDYLISPGEKFFVVMQDDGNLCVYKGASPSDQGDLMWGSIQVGGYEPKDGSYLAKMQDDGNLAIYRDGAFVWGTVQDGGYDPSKRDYYASMQDDGNFCVYRGMGPMASEGFVWGSMQSRARKG